MARAPPGVDDDQVQPAMPTEALSSAPTASYPAWGSLTDGPTAGWNPEAPWYHLLFPTKVGSGALSTSSLFLGKARPGWTLTSLRPHVAGATSLCRSGN